MNKIKYPVITALAVIHQVITHHLCKSIFTVPPSENTGDYVICTICAFVICWFFYHALWQVIIDKNRSSNTITRVIKKALPYLIVMIAVSAVKLRGGYLSNDETLIYENAVSLTHYTWFYYITTYYYIVSLMLIPHMYAPIFVKLIIEYLVVGYTVLRASDYFDTRTEQPFISLGKKGQIKIGYGQLTMLLFLLYPVIAYTTSAHRLPIYFLLYLFMMVMLLFDRLEQSVLTLQRLATLMFLGAVLTQWRTEGIYLFVLIPILMFITYSTISIPGITLRDADHDDKEQPLISISGNRTYNIKTRSVMVTVLVVYILIQYLVSIPQNGIAARELGAAADDRMKPFYAYTITNMYRNGLDMDKNADDLAIVDKYISLDSLDAINEYYGDINYEDVLILYQPGFVGVREEADVTEYYNFVAALKRIFKNNPQIFLRTRIGAFVYAALPYHITFTGTDPRSLVSLALSIVKSISYNLFIPLIIVLFILFYALTGSRWFTFFVSGGLLAHWFIVFILAPASYFKYYFPVYITAYLYLLLIIIAGVHNRKHRTKIKILQ
ncbi:MAG: hypothetical protein K6E53_09115 [Lachnospiraceae bacterium]|nr:hypothetical protein [Lachnospiraceae bacterium]